jgi:NAD dependent epimerase/dehydratase family enzyme
MNGIIDYVINNKKITGPLNCASPGIVREKVFAKTLSKILKRPSFFPVPRLMLKAAIGEIADAILSSQNISVEKLLNSGYDFKYADISSALNNLLKE